MVTLALLGLPGLLLVLDRDPKNWLSVYGICDSFIFGFLGYREGRASGARWQRVQLLSNHGALIDLVDEKRRRDYIERARAQGESLPVVAQALKDGRYRDIWTI
jgi:hypothetical protein